MPAGRLERGGGAFERMRRLTHGVALFGLNGMMQAGHLLLGMVQKLLQQAGHGWLAAEFVYGGGQVDRRRRFCGLGGAGGLRRQGRAGWRRGGGVAKPVLNAVSSVSRRMGLVSMAVKPD